MHTIIKWFGLLQVILGVVIIAGVIFAALAGASVLFGPYLLLIGFGSIVSGALFACFGAIVEHLIAIRTAAEKTAAAFDRMGR